VKKGRVTTLRENIFNGAEKSKGQNQATMPRNDAMPWKMSFEGVTCDTNGDHFVSLTEDGLVDLPKLLATVLKIKLKFARQVC
jgi:hypothetical protein